jgi:[acyl-carrier-protein] S-malonyltransferase
MAAAGMRVLGVATADIEALCRGYDRVYPANYNAPGQVVVAGEEPEIIDFCYKIAAIGGKTIRLAVGGAFHSPMMAGAAGRFREALALVPVDKPRLPLYANVTAQPYGRDPRVLLVEQIYSSVRWQQTVENMFVDGCRTFVEVGPGKTLCGLIRRIAPGARVAGVENMDSLHKTLDLLGGKRDA